MEENTKKILIMVGFGLLIVVPVGLLVVSNQQLRRENKSLKEQLSAKQPKQEEEKK